MESARCCVRRAENGPTDVQPAHSHRRPELPREESDMNGAESLVRTLLQCGRRYLLRQSRHERDAFCRGAGPVPGMRCVLGLQENVVTGMADGYCRIAVKPACTLLHCGPGLANGLANLHNARRARSGIVNIVGDQATYHRPFDAPLTADTDALARTVSHWVRTSTSSSRCRPRCRRGGPGGAHIAGADCHPDPALRHLLGRRRRGCRCVGGPGRAADRSVRRAEHSRACCATMALRR